MLTPESFALQLLLLPSMRELLLPSKRELPAWPNGYSARQLKLLANPLALGRVRIQEASKNRQQFFL